MDISYTLTQSMSYCRWYEFHLRWVFSKTKWDTTGGSDRKQKRTSKRNQQGALDQSIDRKRERWEEVAMDMLTLATAMEPVISGTKCGAWQVGPTAAPCTGGATPPSPCSASSSSASPSPWNRPSSRCWSFFFSILFSCSYLLISFGCDRSGPASAC